MSEQLTIDLPTKIAVLQNAADNLAAAKRLIQNHPKLGSARGAIGRERGKLIKRVDSLKRQLADQVIAASKPEPKPNRRTPRPTKRNAC